MTATATVTPAAAPPRKHRRVTVALASVKLTLAAGETKIARPTLSKANARRLVKALRGRRGLEVSVQIAAQATTGEPAAVDEAVERDAVTGVSAGVCGAPRRLKRAWIAVAGQR